MAIDIRLSTLPRKSNTNGITVLGYGVGGVPTGIDPVAFYPSANQIGAVTISDFSQSLSVKQNLADKGLANGYASLGSDGKVPVAQLPTVSGGGATLANTDPSPLGSANPGVLTTASRADHIHNLPTASQVGAAAVNHLHTFAGVSGLQLALDGKLAVTTRGAIGGVASLGADGLVPTSQLPPTTVPQAALDAKADAAATTAALALKASITYVDTGLSNKLNANDVRVTNAVQADYLNVPITFSGALTVAQTDNNKTRRCLATGDVTVTLPALSVGTTIKFTQGAAGRMVFAAGAGQTLESVSNAIISNGKGTTVIAHCQSANLWNISGNLV